MELQSRLIARRDPKADEQEMVVLMVNYFKKFGAKQVAAMDLKLFLPAIEGPGTKEFFAEIHKQISFDERMAPTDVDQLHRHVNAYQLHRFTGIKRSSSNCPL